ncbi:hypothetical protein SAMD00023353_1500360 [Rosellinia necatrix]|uniref:Uncharacterized protein n=1 Tax=Rosellinia necatrix TaxID=77044 RepID=A0A1W2TJ21_ROSNE|nr:hypothetical protein SAMD00023353_1500360 [Rosellinia necatrix]
MAGYNGRTAGSYYPLTLESPRDLIPRSEPDNDAKSSTSEPSRTFTPRGQRFSSLSDAYSTITSRQVSSNTVRKVSVQSQASSVTSCTVALPSSPVASLRPAEPHDDDEIPSLVSAVPGSMKKYHRISFDSVDSVNSSGDLLSKMGRKNGGCLSLGSQIEKEIFSLEGQSHDGTNSTIDGILAQYDAYRSSFNTETVNKREHRANIDWSISQPPRGSLPDPPHARPTSSMRQSDYDSPAPDSSITDSQHLLDAEAQAYELEEARKALVPSPLNAVQRRRAKAIARDQQHDAPNNAGSCIVSKATAHASDTAMTQVRGYGTYLQYSMERDISRKLRRMSRAAGNTSGTFCGSDVDVSSQQQDRFQGNISSQSNLPTTGTTERRLRHIRVTIGRQSENVENNHRNSCTQTNGERDRPVLTSEEDDWVTEATGDVGFDSSIDSPAGRQVGEGFKRAGSSVADYSEDGDESTMDRFGSRERIIQHPAGDMPYKSYDVRRLEDSKLMVLLPRRPNGFPENATRRWESTGQETVQFRHQILRRNDNPYRQLGCGRSGFPKRFVFDFDKNYPPRYEFRDSVSEYEPATASTKAICGTHQCDTDGSLPSPVSDIEEPEHSSTAGSHLDRSTESDDNRNPPGRLPNQNKANQSTSRDQNMKLSTYAADRPRQSQSLGMQEFAAASSYHEPPSISSVGSKFNFELLPLSLAQQKDKEQRDSGRTKETESAAHRTKQKQSSTPTNKETSPIAQPGRAFFTSPELSAEFLPPRWQTHSENEGVTRVSFPTDRPNVAKANRTRRQQRDSGSEGTSCGALYVWGKQQGRYVRQNGLLPCFAVPENYVSHRAERLRKFAFYILVILSLLPFFGLLALSSAFSEAFKWATKGEVDGLTRRQRRFIKWMLLAEAIVYTGCFVAVVVYFVVKNQNGN